MVKDHCIKNCNQISVLHFVLRGCHVSAQLIIASLTLCLWALAYTCVSVFFTGMSIYTGMFSGYFIKIFSRHEAQALHLFHYT